MIFCLHACCLGQIVLLPLLYVRAVSGVSKSDDGVRGQILSNGEINHISLMRREVPRESIPSTAQEVESRIIKDSEPAARAKSWYSNRAQPTSFHEGEALDGSVQSKTALAANRQVFADFAVAQAPTTTTTTTTGQTTTAATGSQQARFVLGLRGSVSCTTEPVLESFCLQAVQQLLPAGVIQGRTQLVTGSWPHVPPGCSVQSGGDWAAHFNRNNSVGNDGSYTPVCEARARVSLRFSGNRFLNRPVTWLMAEDYDASWNRWANRGSGQSIRNVVRQGSLNIERTAGKGATEPISMVRGNVQTQLVFGNIVPSSDFTFCSLTRYAGDTRGRILNGGGNWLFGHWKGTAGVAHTQRWVTSQQDLRGDSWVALCARSGSTVSDVLLDGVPIGNGNRVEMPRDGEVTVNSNGNVSCCADNERSDFAIAEILVWQGDALTEGMTYLQNLLRLGRSAKASKLLRGVASQSSTFGSFSARQGNDGNMTDLTHTLQQRNPWWQMDFGSTQLIRRIRLLNREGQCASRLFSSSPRCKWERSGRIFAGSSRGAIIRVSDSPCRGTWCPGTTCRKLRRPKLFSHWYNIKCPASVSGRYVSVQLPGKSRILNFREVQVFRRSKVKRHRVDLSSSAKKDFTLTAAIRTSEPNVTIASKTNRRGLWRAGRGGREPKLLSLRNGVVRFDVGRVGAIVGSRRVDDGERHSVGVRWDSSRRQFSILVDGGVDAVSQNTLGRQLIRDLKRSKFRLGKRIGTQRKWFTNNGDVSPAMVGRIWNVRYNDVKVRARRVNRVSSRSVGLASGRFDNFNISARIQTQAANASIVGKTLPMGLWRQDSTNASTGQSKLLYLRQGRVCFAMNDVGVIEGNTPVNDGKPHQVGVRWNRQEQSFSILVDGRTDEIVQDSLRSRFFADGNQTQLMLGRAVGSVVTNGVANGDVAQDMDGWIGNVVFNGAQVDVMPYLKVGPLSVNLGNSAGRRNFSLTANITTLSPNGTILGKVFRNGLWRNGTTGHPKLLYLVDGRVMFRVGYSFTMRGQSRVNDGQEHTVGVQWDSRNKAYNLLVDGRIEANSSQIVGNVVFEDEPRTLLVLGRPVGEHIVNGVANDLSPQFNGRIRQLLYMGENVQIDQYSQISPEAIDLSSRRDRDFNLSVRIRTTAENATLVAKTYAKGQWRDGAGDGQPKLLFLRGGRVCFRIGGIGVIEGARTVNDGLDHEVEIRWVSSAMAFVIVVDGRRDDIMTDGLRARIVSDDAATSIQVGVAVGNSTDDFSTTGEQANRMIGRINGLRFNGDTVAIPPFGQVTPSSIDLGSRADRDFNLTADIRTAAENATIAGKVFLDGLWRSSAKLLYLSGGRVAFEVASLGSVVGSSRVDDNRPHEVGVVWNSSRSGYSILVDGKLDTTSSDTLRSQLALDSNDTSFVLGIGVGSQVSNNRANGDKSRPMIGLIGELKYNGQSVAVEPYFRANRTFPVPLSSINVSQIFAPLQQATAQAVNATANVTAVRDAIAQAVNATINVTAQNSTVNSSQRLSDVMQSAIVNVTTNAPTATVNASHNASRNGTTLDGTVVQKNVTNGSTTAAPASTSHVAARRLQAATSSTTTTTRRVLADMNSKSSGSSSSQNQESKGRSKAMLVGILVPLFLLLGLVGAGALVWYRFYRRTEEQAGLTAVVVNEEATAGSRRPSRDRKSVV